MFAGDTGSFFWWLKNHKCSGGNKSAVMKGGQWQMHWGESTACHQKKAEEKKEGKKRRKLALYRESHAVALGSNASTHPSPVISGALSPHHRCLPACVPVCLPLVETSDVSLPVRLCPSVLVYTTKCSLWQLSPLAERDRSDRGLSTIRCALNH